MKTKQSLGTPFDDIFTRFSRKITDFSMFYNDDDAIFTEQRMIGFLDSAIARFKSCRTPLDRDNHLGYFDNCLSELEQEILSSIMVVEWIRPYLTDVDNLQQYISDKELKRTSQANHIYHLRQLKRDLESDVYNLYKKYSYRENEISISDLI